MFPADVEVRPPVRRGDVETLVSTEKPGTLLIVDGTFHSYPAVGHAELRAALQRGWHIWGLSSMGAIRAAEMESLGMRGYGAVYQRFASDPSFSDDEVALLHSAEPPYRPMSEPMVHIRCFLDSLVVEGKLSVSAAEEVATALKNRWYGYRTHRALSELLPVDDVLRAEHRLKTTDLLRFTEEQPWR
ncbi:TfuA-like protein [Allokutzneria sp. NRRL B-24872]|uniref:TfuA-like protein n=1 Tax=Allokutzneria sp. NRRL B-24872 TaxID=1137961 RepID=UPI000A39B7CB|nr:TfuA-like protein [Allokutzneria sp. NRRL B-24872]